MNSDILGIYTMQKMARGWLATIPVYEWVRVSVVDRTVTIRNRTLLVTTNTVVEIFETSVSS